MKAIVAESSLSLTVSVQFTCTIDVLRKLAMVTKMILPCAAYSGPVSFINTSHQPKESLTFKSVPESRMEVR